MACAECKVVDNYGLYYEYCENCKQYFPKNDAPEITIDKAKCNLDDIFSDYILFLTEGPKYPGMYTGISHKAPGGIFSFLSVMHYAMRHTCKIREKDFNQFRGLMGGGALVFPGLNIKSGNPEESIKEIALYCDKFVKWLKEE